MLVHFQVSTLSRKVLCSEKLALTVKLFSFEVNEAGEMFAGKACVGKQPRRKIALKRGWALCALRWREEEFFQTLIALNGFSW